MLKNPSIIKEEYSCLIHGLILIPQNPNGIAIFRHMCHWTSKFWTINLRSNADMQETNLKSCFWKLHALFSNCHSLTWSCYTDKTSPLCLYLTRQMHPRNTALGTSLHWGYRKADMGSCLFLFHGSLLRTTYFLATCKINYSETSLKTSLSLSKYEHHSYDLQDVCSYLMATSLEHWHLFPKFKPSLLLNTCSLDLKLQCWLLHSS